MVRITAFVAVALAAAGYSDATNPTPPCPLNAQDGALHFPVTCEVYGFLNQTFDTIFTATAPIYGGTGQEIYYSDVSGVIDVPSYIVGLAHIVGAKQARADISIGLRLTNASPSTIIAYQGTQSNITLPSKGDALIRVPQGNGTLPAIGPVTLGSPGPAHRIFLGNVEVNITLQNAAGHDVFGPIPVTCGRQNIDYVIGSVNINSTTGAPPFAPAVGYVATFQPTPLNFESGYFRFPYNCNFGPLGPQNLDIAIGGTIPTYFSPGQKFYLTNADAFLNIPSSLVTLAKSAFPNATNFDTTIDNVEILFSNASPGSFNAAQTALRSVVPIPADTSQQLTIPIPNDGILPPVGPITAGSDGQIVGVAMGVANATTSITDSAGNVLFSFAVGCSVPSSLEIIGVAISSQKPGNYSLGIPHA